MGRKIQGTQIVIRGRRSGWNISNTSYSIGSLTCL